MGQLRAFDVERKRKRLLVRRGKGAWWGVDPSTKRIALAAIGEHGERSCAVISVEQREGANRLEAIREATLQLCADFRDLFPPGVVLVEEPAGFGKRPNPELAYAVGATLCGLVVGVPFTTVDFVASAKWKAQVCGYGGIAKPKPTEKRKYAVLEWAQANGYDGTSWDAADAWAIAQYARETYELDERHEAL